MVDLNNRVALVTGAASGIGAATAKQLAKDGAHVVAADINFDGAKKISSDINNDGGESIGLMLDVSSESSWQETINQIKDHYGYLDILFNNAGVGGEPKNISDETMDDWSYVIKINQTGVMLGMKYGSRLMMAENRKGSIINTSSIFGLVGGFGSNVAYHAAKGAVTIMTKNAALYLAKSGIRVNSIHPGFIETPILGSADRNQLAEVTPLGRIGEPQEIANVVAFLASDESSFMTGSEIVVDGGYTAR
jgi:NAD(P)-dependent dehydrogenase (short-subunit alcohol dehydrogenase family)